MHRREVFTFLGVVATWPWGVRAQQEPATPATSKQGQASNGSTSMPENGLVSVQSRSPAPETVERLLSALAKRKLAIYARVDHAAGAASVGLQLRPTELVIFGNPRAGTPLMQAAQTLGIDFPLKALVWQDEGGKTWLAYNDAAWFAERHGLGAASADAVNAIAAGMAAVTRYAAEG